MTESENSFLIGVSSTGVFNKTEDKVKEYIETYVRMILHLLWQEFLI